jgi:diguanylate cyclase (GGDEF)-like protein
VTTSSGNKLTRAAERLRTITNGSLSISHRLALAFVMVLLLAVGVNVLIARAPQVARLKSWSPPATNAPLAPSGHAVEPTAPVVATPQSDMTATLAERRAGAALREFENAVLQQFADQAIADPLGLRTTGRALELAVSDVFPNGPPAVSHQRLRALQAEGQELVRLAAHRRALFASSADHLSELDSELKAALNGSWSIFGRVIARQSLVSLSQALAEVRHRYSNYLSHSDAQGALSALTAATTDLGKLLDLNAASLERVQGSSWLIDTRTALGSLTQDLTELAVLATVDAPTQQKFVAHVENFARLIEVEGRAPDASKPAAKLVDPSFGAVPASGALVESVPQPSVQETNGRLTSPTLVAAVTAIVLFLVLMVLVATIRSIVNPVRAFRRVTERLASGDLTARFEKVGVRELDVFALAFNRMAESLEAAHAETTTHRAALEVKVVERTRQLQHLASHDALTGLPNRRGMLAFLDDALSRADLAHSRVALFFLDLDNFKDLNDSMGHLFGDLVLRAVAERLEQTAASGVATRLGGDEFTVIQSFDREAEQVIRLGQKLVEAFASPLLIDGREIVVSVSVGVSVYPNHGQDSDGLMRAADAALFRAKSLGRSQLSVFSDDLHERASVKFRTEQALRRAVEREEWELLFQPEACFDTLSVPVVEALLRWRRPDGGLVSPVEFLGIAEESGLIGGISEWVLREAVQRAALWHRGPWAGARVAVNVSARQLLDVRFVDRLCALLSRNSLPARSIEIELTENVIQTGRTTLETLHQLRELGVSVALDDFGSGYSSLASLEQLPLTRVKLDRSLIAAIDKNARSLSIARSIVGLCSSLELEVTAEGVERCEQLSLLLQVPQPSIQGYLISHPVAGDAIPTVLSSIPGHLQNLLLGTGVNRGVPALTAPIQDRVSNG